MKNLKFSLVFVASLMLALMGCWTVHESDFPQVEFSKAPANQDVCVQLSGFEAMVTSYQAVYGYETVMRPWHTHRHGRRYYGGISTETYATTTYVPQTTPTTAFVDRARERLEDAGYLVHATNAPRYRIDVKFSGPFISGEDRSAQALWLICSLLTADYAAQTWTADLRIYNTTTGRLLLHTDYTEKYSAAVWGPLPIFSPAGADEVTLNYGQTWCLSALTDRALADATAFIAAQSK